VGPILLCYVVMEISTGWAGFGGGGEGFNRQLLVSVPSVNISSIPLALSLLSMASIVPDEEVFSQFTEKSKKQYRRICDVEVDGENELPVEMVQEEEEDLSGLVLEDDPDMYAAAGITYQPSSTSGNSQL
jgi:hypothetical protein